MAKNLSDMTLEELWELFPIVLTAHQTEWKNQYEHMEHVLREHLRTRKVVRISHIGSTAVPLIWAKPIVDILLEIASDEDMRMVSDVITSIGFLKMSESDNRLSFNYGYTSEGFADAVYHLHLRYCGDNDELYFRDYLNANPDVARAYESLKLELWHRFEHKRDAYTAAKGDFVEKYTRAAKKLYGDIYKKFSEVCKPCETT